MAKIDEFYMNRIYVDQTALAKVGIQEFPLRIKKIYPLVIDGQFRVDLVFTHEQPVNISRGQTLQLRLQMGANELLGINCAGSFAPVCKRSWRGQSLQLGWPVDARELA